MILVKIQKILSINLKIFEIEISNTVLHQEDIMLSIDNVKYLVKKLFKIFLILISAIIISLIVFISIFGYLHDYYEYYSYYSFNKVTITKVVKGSEIKIYYGKYLKNDKKPYSFIYCKNYEINKVLFFHNDSKIYILDNSGILDNFGKDTNFIIMNPLDYTFFKKGNNIQNISSNKLIFNNFKFFYNKSEDIDNFQAGSKVKREYELGKNNIVDKIF